MTLEPWKGDCTLMLSLFYQAFHCVIFNREHSFILFMKSDDPQIHAFFVVLSYDNKSVILKMDKTFQS